MKTFSPNATTRDLYEPAMRIEDEQQAKEYFDALIAWCLDQWKHQGKPVDRKEAEKVQRANLGYYAGFFDFATRVRVERLFGGVHPVFGSTDGSESSPEEVIELGQRIAEKLTELIQQQEQAK